MKGGRGNDIFKKGIKKKFKWEKDEIQNIYLFRICFKCTYKFFGRRLNICERN